MQNFLYWNVADAARYENDFFHSISAFFHADADEVQIDRVRFAAFARQMYSGFLDFPHNAGTGAAPEARFFNSSAFKKVGWFVASFMEHTPISDVDLPADLDGRYSAVPNFVNAAFAFDAARVALHRVYNVQAAGKNMPQLRRIEASEHTYFDVLHAFSMLCEGLPKQPDEAQTERVTRYKLISLLFEQMAYQANHEARYANALLPAD